MTYNLEEFNTWYNRQGNNWPSHNWNVACYQRPDWTETFLTSHQNDDYGTRLRAWMALVDERERERERERAQGGDPNMLNFCLWCHEEKRLVPGKFTCYACDSKLPLQVQTEQQAKEVQREQELAQCKQKLTTYRNRRKTSLRQEITLLKEVLHE